MKYSLEISDQADRKLKVLIAILFLTIIVLFLQACGVCICFTHVEPIWRYIAMCPDPFFQKKKPEK